MRLFVGLCTVAALAGTYPVALSAQVKGQPVSQGSGPISEMSTNVRTGSGPVNDPGRSVREGSVGSLSGSSVSESVTGTVLSGAVSDISAGSVTARQPVSGGGTLSDVKSGAVTRDAAAPLRAAAQPVAAEPVYDFAPLEEDLRAIQPLPPFEERPEEVTADVGAEDGNLVAENVTDIPEVPRVEPPDAEDPTQVDQPAEADVRNKDVRQPPPPPVGDPRESVPIEVEGREPPN